MNELFLEFLRGIRLSVEDLISKNKSRFIAELFQIISIPSISTGDGHGEQIIAASRWYSNKLRKMGAVDVQVYETFKNPIVYGEFKSPNQTAPTLLIYGHYDVQPVEPLSKWNSDPFAPIINGSYLYGRGASDMKGQISACLSAIEVLLEKGSLPINIKCIFEGEEEIGSPSLKNFLQSYSQKLKADICLVPDSVMLSKDKPTITYGLRGLANFELKIQSTECDMHSGFFGGIVCNPATEACRLIGALQKPDGTITIDHFYDDVIEASENERLLLKMLPNDAEYYKKTTGLQQLWGESTYQPVERGGIRPTFDVVGFSSGHTSTGFKTIIPSQATVKMSFRLVPYQTPESIQENLRKFIERSIFCGLSWQLNFIDGSPASMVNLESAGIIALAKAMEEVWGTEPAYYRMGGTIPAVGLVNHILGVDTIVTGFSLPDDNFHAPNEKLYLPSWEKGIQTIIGFFRQLSMTQKPRNS